MPLPVDKHAGIRLLLLCNSVIGSHRAVSSGGPGGQNFNFIANADHAAVAGNEILTEIDIAVIHRAAEGLQRCQRFTGWMFLAFFRADSGENTAAAGFCHIKDDLANANHLPGVFLPGASP
ncbi:hypothetical protein D3C81_1465310 [compost metagenome]